MQKSQQPSNETLVPRQTGIKYTDPVSVAVHTYLRTGMLPPTDIDVPIPGPDYGPGEGMTGCITQADIKYFSRDWYIGCDGELYHKNEGPGPVRFDADQGKGFIDKIKEKVLPKPEPFHDWND
ncbi:uncharacterized protein SPPG_07934 [Spizellomyces punctatus DAOM BR117]|uniref:Uncharacterized protein n=1 Tax=Spizellomyces punctatus (strain DAOM BR117) TaxID=645134 RepID=A0A0L0H5E2_SPIPD|nr:uncharacterized protein SPPG_07934 [Spizellomyces punctatus DAOM BR117]KNC96725.1 hypothetical protein SPPG_07934 [Spizellomyces punctatus DAOM BR117]|eukprot:XP_016604765.1 hypothetical protein SPPG_07934 [Spizellomyces punctatus DAOM BR117]